MTRVAKVFLNGRSQAIRIPKEMRVDSSEVLIEKVGDSLIITPKEDNRWDRLYKSLQNIDADDFLIDRVQPPLEERGDIFG